MEMYITLYEDEEGTAVIAQRNAVQIAKELGFREMPLRGLRVEDYTYRELKNRIYGIITGINAGDVVIFQSPTWQGNSLYYDKLLMDAFRFHNVRTAILIHDVAPFMFGGTEETYKKIIDIYNMAELVIGPSQSMLTFLREKGMTVEKVLVQILWDFPFGDELRIPEFQRQMIFSGSPDRFRFLASWKYNTPLRLFQKDCQLDGVNIHFEGWKNTTELLVEYTKGGFGLIWEQSENPEYYKCILPYKLGGYLASGIPVIIQKGLSPEPIIQKYKLGFVVESLDEAAHIVQSITEEEYYKLIDNIKNISFMIKKGMFTKKLLLDAVSELLLEEKDDISADHRESYHFLRENGHRAEALVCTNSDRIEHCEDLVRSLPEMHFHIAALTTMSPRLLRMGDYSNVTLYPGINEAGIKELFDLCDYYFDINHWKEIVSAVYKAFIYNNLIFAFEETVHRRKYIAKENIYLSDNFEQMISDIKAVIGDEDLLEQRLDRQRKEAMEKDEREK